MPTLTADQIYAYAIGAGFPPSTATTMTAIALRESSGQTDAFNGKVVACPDGSMACGDQSYGLWQINMLGAQGTPFGPCSGGQCGLGPARMVSLGLSDPSELFDPGVNAAAAYQIWGGNDANLDIAWYVDRVRHRCIRFSGFDSDGKKKTAPLIRYHGVKHPEHKRNQDDLGSLALIDRSASRQDVVRQREDAQRIGDIFAALAHLVGDLGLLEAEFLGQSLEGASAALCGTVMMSSTASVPTDLPNGPPDQPAVVDCVIPLPNVP
jgi:hypothetical protein